MADNQQNPNLKENEISAEAAAGIETPDAVLAEKQSEDSETVTASDTSETMQATTEATESSDSEVKEAEATVESESPDAVVPESEGPVEVTKSEPEAVAEAPSETMEETPSTPDGADEGDQGGTDILAEEAEEEPRIMSFTGSITGPVLTLAEADQVDSDDEEEVVDQELLSLYESSMTSVEENQVVSGRVVTVGEKDVVIDIGFKSDGIVPRNEFDEEVSAGTDVEVYLERIEDRNGQLVLSKRRADELRRWQRIEDAHENDSIVEGEIINRIKGGMIVDLFGSEAFLPGSQIDIRPVRDFDAYLGKRMEFKVVKINPMNGNVVVSHKALIEKDLESQREQILSTMEAGQVIEGTVKNITDFGVFIDLGGVDGLLHITDLSWGRVGHPSEVVDLDQKIKVVVLDYDKERQRISLGLKQLTPHPWEDIAERFAENSVVKGKVVSITDYGAFVELDKGIEGLVHISEMSWTQHIKHPTEVVSLDDEIDVKVLKIDQDARKISLGIKQLSPDPWEKLAENFPAGTVTKGIVRNVTNFGVFVEIEQGIDGLVHISDLSWTRKIKHPSEIVSKGQELDVVILSVDQENRRLSLGHKQIDTNPWNQFQSAYAEGSETTGRIVRFLDNGVIVMLPLDVEAFVPGSQLVKSAQDLSEVYTMDQELDLRVIEFNLQDRKIVLSERARRAVAEKKEKQSAERERKRKAKADAKITASYKRATGSGAATLGELSGLEDLKAKMQAAEEEAVASAEEPAPEPTVSEAKDETTPEHAAESVAEETEEPVAEEAQEAVEEETPTEPEEAAEVVAEESAVDVADESVSVAEEEPQAEAETAETAGDEEEDDSKKE
jgi:small subunit ribosomal protein S1